jgi:hypothetical protein
MQRIVWLSVIAQICLASCAMRSSREIDNQRAEQFAMEKGRLSELTDPVEIARCQITISRILLEFAASGLAQRDVDGANRRIAQYTASIQAARDAMTGSGLNPLQKPAGYSDLVTATREYTRSLESMRSALPQDQQSTLNSARGITDSIHSEMLRLLSTGIADD